MISIEELHKKADAFASFTLTADLSTLTAKEKQMLPILFEAAALMEEIFWKEAYGDREMLLNGVDDPKMLKFLKINYGPWERLNNNEPFIKGYGEKPHGACFYPLDMTREEFENWDEPAKASLYTLIQRDKSGKIIAVPYHRAFAPEIEKAAKLLHIAAGLAEDDGLKKYLTLRAKALQTDDYFESDMAWMDMKTNAIDFVIGPIENYEDQLFGYKAAHESFILIKDKEWSQKLEKYTALLPGLQKALPVEQAYKNETPGTGSDMNVYNAVYYAGDCNAGSKTIAINLPNDEKVRELRGSRKLQLKNSMQAKFDKILMPIANLLIDQEQRKHVKFDAFFENTMFHEVAHGLGLGKLTDQSATVREALKNNYTSIEEGKADILGLWCVYQLTQQGEFTDKDLMDNFVTFMAGIFRSVRFGAASAHGKANMMRFYYFQEKGAFERNPATGTYRVNFEKMKEAMFSLSQLLLSIQGDGDYEKAGKIIEEMGFIREELQKDLYRISQAGIPVDIYFEQGPQALGL
ncbi:MAG: Zn-dependent hydrolase [Prolixibacteraceae bacterium]|nr:Zn-dependent hydrolase [Prolixibacteraceae bacterium]